MVNVRKSSVADIIRFIFSSLILLFSLVVIFYAIIMEKTSFWDSVPGIAALFLFIVFLFLLGLVAGLQIALVELKRQHPDSYKHSYPRAYELGERAASGDNVERFLLGRQVVVVIVVFFSAKLTTITLSSTPESQHGAMMLTEPRVSHGTLNTTMQPHPTDLPSGAEDLLLFAPDWFRNIFLESGILACIIVVNVAQLMPQIVAAKFPVRFLQFWVMKPIYWLCILIELTGLTHVAWLLSELMMLCFKMKEEDVTAKPNDIKRAISELGSTLNTSEGLSSESPEPTRTNDENSDPYPTESGVENESTIRLVSKNYAGGTRTPKHRDNKNSFELNGTDNEEELRQCFDVLVAAYHKELHSSPKKFRVFPYVAGNGKLYPSPGGLASDLRRAGCTVPNFLLDVYDPNHMPPHIVACELCSLVAEKNQELELLRAKIENLENKRC